MQVLSMSGPQYARFAQFHNADSPQIPDAHFAVIASRDYPVLLLVGKVYISHWHEVGIWDVCYSFHALHIPYLTQRHSKRSTRVTSQISVPLHS